MQKYPDEYEGTKKNVRALGIILLIIGGLLLIYGVGNIFTVFGTSPGGGTMEEFQDTSAWMMQTFLVGGISIFIGFVMVGFGSQMIMASKAKEISKYAASQMAPATEMVTEAVASGLSKGFGGKSPVSGQKEVIKIKCRNCGYLETEDADFCSKCGERM